MGPKFNLFFYTVLSLDSEYCSCRWCNTQLWETDLLLHLDIGYCCPSSRYTSQHDAHSHRPSKSNTKDSLWTPYLAWQRPPSPLQSSLSRSLSLFPFSPSSVLICLVCISLNLAFILSFLSSYIRYQLSLFYLYVYIYTDTHTDINHWIFYLLYKGV